MLVFIGGTPLLKLLIRLRNCLNWLIVVKYWLWKIVSVRLLCVSQYIRFFVKDSFKLILLYYNVLAWLTIWYANVVYADARLFSLPEYK